MTLQDLIDSNKYQIVNEGTDLSKKLTRPFCCDLLSVAMSRASEGCVWVTVMSNVNTLAVASLTETGCIILAEGRTMDEGCVDKAKEQDITVLRSTDPIFETAEAVYEMMKK